MRAVAKVETAELNRRVQVIATNSWPGFHPKQGTGVDYRVATPTEARTFT